MPNVLVLTDDEFKYIKNSHLVNEILLDAAKSEAQISDHQIDDLEELFSERLQKVGFDIHYNLTDEGKILENILDKLSTV